MKKGLILQNGAQNVGLIHLTPVILLMKGGQIMDLLKSMNDAMRYIEDNLTNEIGFKVVARLAHCSEYHFKRMFSFREVPYLKLFFNTKHILPINSFENQYNKAGNFRIPSIISILQFKNFYSILIFDWDFILN